VKTRIQFTPALIMAIVCSLAWFALWLSAFHPVPEPSFPATPHLAATIFPATDETLSPFRAPTLFALPSEQGFSGTFPEDRVNVRLSLERPHQPKTYLPRQPTDTPAPNPTQLTENIPLPESELPAPGATRTTVIRQPERIAFFFSPELASRATDIETPDVITALPGSSIRIRLSVRPDGNVAHAFCETPIEQPTLLRAIRNLRFTPSSEKTEGWLDIRFTPDREKAGGLR